MDTLKLAYFFHLVPLPKQVLLCSPSVATNKALCSCVLRVPCAPALLRLACSPASAFEIQQQFSIISTSLPLALYWMGTKIVDLLVQTSLFCKYYEKVKVCSSPLQSSPLSLLSLLYPVSFSFLLHPYFKVKALRWWCWLPLYQIINSMI